MANYKKKSPLYRSSTRRRTVRHAQPYRRYQQEDKMNAFVKKVMCQSMICLCLLMGVLIVQKIPNSSWSETIKSTITGNFPFAKYEQKYQQFLANMLPFEYRLPQTTDSTSLVSGAESVMVDEEGNIISEESASSLDYLRLVNNVYQNIILDNYEDGVIIQTTPDELIKSFVSGIVLSVGSDDKISNFMNVQLANDLTLTIGFLENRNVSQYQHIQVGDALGVASMLDISDETLSGNAFYYLALKDYDGNYQDVKAYLESLMQ